MSVHWGGKGPGHVSRWPRGVGAISPYSGATMLLDFLNPVLDPRITFSRGTNATLIDSTGRLTYAPNNLVQRSQELENVYWVKLAVSATGDVTTAPDGTTTADKVVATASAFTRRLLYANATLAASTNIFSFYAKASEYSLVRTVDSAGGSRWFASFDLSNGTLVGGTTGGAQFVSAGISDAGNGWYRCWVVFNAAAGAGAIGMVGYPAGATLDQFGVQYAGDGTSGTFFWGLQLEQVTYQTTPSAYAITTTAFYYSPRFDYAPVTLAPRGLLVEEVRTNLLLRSEELNDAYWTKQDVTITANSTASPSGAVNADTVIPSTTLTGIHRVTVNPGAGAAAHALTCYVKTAGYTWFKMRMGSYYANFDVTTGVAGLVSAGATSSIAAVGNGWYRCTILMSANLAGDNIFLYVAPSNNAGLDPVAFSGDGTSGLFVWGVQLELGTFATSYIPTVASTVTRNADIATMTGANFSSWYNQIEGTFAAQYDSYLVDTSIRNALSAYASGATANNILFINAVQRQFQINNAGNQADLDGGTPASDAVIKAAGAYKVNDFALSLDGGAVVTDTVGTVPTVDTLGIGISSLGLTPINGHIRTLAYFNTRLPNDQLVALST